MQPRSISFVPAALRRLELGDRPRRRCRRNTAALDVQGVWLQRALVAGLRQPDGVEHPERNVVGVGGRGHLRLADVLRRGCRDERDARRKDRDGRGLHRTCAHPRSLLADEGGGAASRPGTRAPRFRPAHRTASGANPLLIGAPRIGRRRGRIRTGHLDRQTVDFVVMRTQEIDERLAVVIKHARRFRVFRAQRYRDRAPADAELDMDGPERDRMKRDHQPAHRRRGLQRCDRRRLGGRSRGNSACLRRRLQAAGIVGDGGRDPPELCRRKTAAVV